MCSKKMYADYIIFSFSCWRHNSKKKKKKLRKLRNFNISDYEPYIKCYKKQ